MVVYTVTMKVGRFRRSRQLCVTNALLCTCVCDSWITGNCWMVCSQCVEFQTTNSVPSALLLTNLTR